MSPFLRHYRFGNKSWYILGTVSIIVPVISKTLLQNGKNTMTALHFVAWILAFAGWFLVILLLGQVHNKLDLLTKRVDVLATKRNVSGPIITRTFNKPNASA